MAAVANGDYETAIKNSKRNYTDRNGKSLPLKDRNEKTVNFIRNT